ncbi:MAG: NfeD family protein, partial [Gemmatimonadota bacterium]
EGIGVLSIGALVAFVLGSLMLYSPFSPPSPALPEVHVSLWLIVAVAAMMAALLLFVGRALLRVRRAPVASGADALIGQVGVAESRLAPAGTVRIGTEVWSAELEPGADAIAPGAAVEVVGLEGVMLRVRKQRAESARPSEEV